MEYVIYRCDLTLHDYLFFASTERGKVAETSPFVHNYALTYALGWAPVVWYNGQQKARYREELSPIRSHYITPAKLVRGATAVMQYNTLSERLKFEKYQSVGYPDWGFIKCFRPDALFRAYIIASKTEIFPRYIRLGKFMTMTKVDAVAATKIVQKQGPFKVTHLLNWSDLQKKPIAFNMQVGSLPTRLISQASYEDGAFLQATFSEDEEVSLPLDMGYLLGA